MLSVLLYGPTRWWFLLREVTLQNSGVGQERVAMDVEFSIADTFEELRPDWKRADTGEVDPAS